MNFIGHGSVGYVYNPPVQCGTCKSNKKHVGKVYANEADFIHEREIHYNIIKSIDPEGYFTPKLLGECKELNFYQLCFEYSGEQLSYKNFKPSMMLSPSLPVYYGLTQLAKYGFCHMDLRHMNLLFNKDVNKIMIIDFNMIEHFNKIYTPMNKTIMQEFGLYVAPEFFIARNVYYQTGKVPSQNKFMDELGNDIAYMASTCYLGDVITESFLENDYHDMIRNNSFSSIKKESYSKIDVYMLGVCFLNMLSETRQPPEEKVVNLLVQMLRPNVFERIDPFQLYEQMKKII